MSSEQAIVAHEWRKVGSTTFTVLAIALGLWWLSGSYEILDIGVIAAVLIAGRAYFSLGMPRLSYFTDPMGVVAPARQYRTVGQPPELVGRGQDLTEMRSRIQATIRAHGLESVMHDQLAQVDQILESHSRLSQEAVRYRAYLAENPLQALEQDLERQELKIARASDHTRPLLVENLAVVRLRHEHVARIAQMVEMLKAQLSTLENAVRLIHDQVQTASSPTDVRLDMSRITNSVAATDAAIAETRAMLAARQAGQLGQS